MGKGKIKKLLKDETPQMMIRLESFTSPQFAHNAGSAGKIPVWTYKFWRSTDKGNTGLLDVTMDLTKAKKMNENKQSVYMNDLAIALLKESYPNDTIKLTSV